MEKVSFVLTRFFSTFGTKKVKWVSLTDGWEEVGMQSSYPGPLTRTSYGKTESEETEFTKTT